MKVDLHVYILKQETPLTALVLCLFYQHNYFLSQPYIFSSSVKSHPLEIFLVILSGGILFGIVGMILAIPLYTVIKVFLKVFFSDNKLVKKLTKNL